MSGKPLIYMVVTNDEYELPLYVGTSREVAAYCGIKKESIYTYMSRKQNHVHKYKIVKVEVDEDED